MADPDAKSQAGDAKEETMDDEKAAMPGEPVTPNAKTGPQPAADPSPQPAPHASTPLTQTTQQDNDNAASYSPPPKAETAGKASPEADELKGNAHSKEENPSTTATAKVVDTSTTPKSTPPPLIVTTEKEPLSAPVVRAKSEDTAGSASVPNVTRTNSDEQRSSEKTTSATTAPPALQSHESGGSDDDGLDEFIKSPHGQNAIVERSPGGRYVRFMEKLGSGASKDVYRAYDTQEGIEVAWNVVSLSGLPKPDRNRIVNEVRLLERLHHHNIISFHGSWVNRERHEVHFVTEILSSGTLKSFINKVQVIRWKIAKRWAVQILSGLEYLHSQDPPVIHRDLKCENIFINGTSGDLRIGDLGLSTVHHNGRVLSVLGTPEFMAPDMYEESSYDQRVDIYAFGMCMLEIFTKEIPYKECKNPAQIYKKVSNGELPETLSRLRSKHARDFVMLCLGHKDEHGEFIRPTAKELLTHEFLIKRSNDEDEVLVDPPLIKRTIAENDAVVNPAWPPASTQNHAQAPKNESVVEKAPSSTLAKTDTDDGSADGDESDRFDEMPDSEVNIRKVKVLMGRGQELKEDEEPLADTSGRSVEGSTHSHASSDRLADKHKQVLKNGVPTLRASKKVSVGSSLQVTQPGHYLVAAAVIENEDGLAYPDDILKLVVTLPVEGQTQNVQFDFHLVEDDPVQVGKEMVSELGIPQGAVLEISETISGLACAARMQRDKHKLKAQQNSQGQMVSQSQPNMQAPQMAGTPQDIQSGMTIQQQQGGPPELSSNQPLQGLQPSDQIPRQPSQQSQPQLSQAANQTSQVPAETQSQPPSYGHLQTQGHVQHHQIQGQLQNQQMNQGNRVMADSQQQIARFGYDPSQANAPQQQQQQQQQQLHQQAMGQLGTSLPLESQSLPTYTYDPGQSQSQGQTQPMQPHQLHQQQAGIPDLQQHPNTYRYDGQQQQQHQGQLNQSMGQQAPMHLGQQQPSQMAPQQLSLQSRSQQTHLQSIVQTHPNNQQLGNNPPVQQVPQMQGQSNQGGSQGQPQSFGHMPPHHVPPQPQDLQQRQLSHGQDIQQMQQQQQQSQQQQLPPQQQQQQQQQHQQQHSQQQAPYPSSPLQQPQQNPRSSAETVYAHGVSLPNASGQRSGIPMGSNMKRSVSTNSHSSQQPNLAPAAQASALAGAGNEKQMSFPSEARLPPSRSSSGHAPHSLGKSDPAGSMQHLGDDGAPGSQERTSNYATQSQLTAVEAATRGSQSSEGEDRNDELRKLDEDFQKNLQRAKKVFDNRMDNLQRNQIEREAQHKKTLEKHQKERTEFEKRLQQEEKEQNRRIEQLQREWDRKREVLSKNQRKVSVSEDEGSVSAEVSLASSPDTGYTMPASLANDQAEHSLNPTMSTDSDR